MINLSRLKTETFNCRFKLTPNLSEMIQGRWCGLLVNCLISIVYKKSIAAYWILFSEFGLVSRIGSFFDVSDGQLKCEINRTSSKPKHSEGSFQLIGKMWVILQFRLFKPRQ